MAVAEQRWGRRALGVLACGVVAAVVGVLLAGCSSTTTGTGASGDGPPTTPKPTPGGKVVYGIEADPNGLDPVNNGWDPSGLLVANAVYDPLAAFDAQGAAQPYLAAAFEHNPAYTEWTIKLRPNIQFHNGEKLTGEAVADFGNAAAASAIVGPALAPVDHFEADGELATKVVMKQPWTTFPVTLTGQPGFVPAPAQLKSEDRSLKPIGTGPFVLNRWDIDERVQVTKNPHYWRNGLPYLDEVEFKPVGDPQQRAEQLQNGQLNMIHSGELRVNTQLEAGAAQQGLTVYHDKGATDPNFVLLNTAKPPLDDVRVRQALAYGTDVKALAAASGWPEDRLSPGLFPKDSPWYVDTGYPGYDPAKAKALIAEYTAEKGPVVLKLGTTPDAESLKQLQTIVEQWQALGVQASGETIDFKDFVIRLVVGQYDTALFRYFGQPDPDVNWQYWSSETVQPLGAISLNFAHLADDQIDAALQDGRTTDDLAKRKEAYAKAQKRFTELMPFVWLYRTDWMIAAADSVHGVENGPLPDGEPSLPMLGGAHRLTQTWVTQAG